MPTQLPTSLLQEKFAKLPEKLREAIASVDTANIVLSIGRAHGIPIDKIGKLAEETGYIMGGVAATKDFIPALAEALDVSAEEAKAIGLEVNQKIFLPIREFLKDMHGAKWSEEIAAGEAPPDRVRRPQAPETPPAGLAAPEKKISAPQRAETRQDESPAKKLEPLIINPLTPRRRASLEEAMGFTEGPLVEKPAEKKEPEKKAEIKPLDRAAPIQAREQEPKPISAAPVSEKASPTSGPEIRPFKPRIMSDEDSAALVQKIPEKRFEATVPAELPKEYSAAKQTAGKEPEIFRRSGDSEKPTSQTAPTSPLITKEKLTAEIERVRAEMSKGLLTAKQPAAEAKKSEPAAETKIPPPQPAATPKPAPAAKLYDIDPYREPVE